MAETYVDAIRTEIERSFSLAAAGKMTSALQSFATARAMSEELADQIALQGVISRDIASCKREREMFRDMLLKRTKRADPLLIFGDSLALPRPKEKVGPTLGAENTYPWLVAAALPGRRVNSICQRYFTTDDILTALQEEPSLGTDADVLIHVGLNDCPNRMFLHGQRLSMNLLPEDLRKRIVGFAQKYRNQIVTSLPANHYVAPDAFRTNLDRIIATLKDRNARRIALTTIILPPSKFWHGTPNINFNFGSYNLDIMTAAYRHKVLLLDLDRYVWQDMPSGPLIEDGMHLSEGGHKLMAEKIVELLGRKAA